MACFLVPTTEAIVMTIVKKSAKAKEAKMNTEVVADNAQSSAVISEEGTAKIPFSRKLSWLTNLLWGGAGLLAFEHVWHGEVTPYFPFLTAASNPQDTAAMLHEMSTVGVSMAALITIVWVGMLAAVKAVENRPSVTEDEAKRI